MRIILIIGLLMGAMSGRAQSVLLDEYKDHFGHNLRLYEDHTFEFNWQFEIYGSWTIGTWALENEILTLRITPVFDTLTGDSSSHSVKADKLIMAQTPKPKRLSVEEYKLTLNATVGQNKNLPSLRYYSKDNKLVIMYPDGRLRLRKTRGYNTRRRYRPWFWKVKR